MVFLVLLLTLFRPAAAPLAVTQAFFANTSRRQQGYLMLHRQFPEK
jgi:hypothetical protein